MTNVCHDPYSAFFRSPCGALTAGSFVTLTLQAEGDVSQVFVRLWRGADEEWLPLHRKAEGIYRGSVSVGREAGLVWYYFVIDGPEGRRYLGKNGESDAEPESFQITVYDPAFDTPRWMRESVTMQIFPDRFNIGSRGAVHPHGRGAFLHGSWDEAPCLCNDKGDREAVDFFGGSLNGIREKLGYIKDMGFGGIYLNPIFRARSNHKYDTGDYEQIDPSFGTQEDFEGLCADAESAGMHVILDGVFSHTGADSRYFNRYGTYDSPGAYSAYPGGPYAKWYSFKKGRDDYECWWGIETLPNVNELEPTYLDYICGESGIIQKYLRLGASGWRLDVADELPMDFIRNLRRRAKSVKPDSCVIGEVWEDITNKMTYGRRRCYAQGDTLDSAMNYPLRTAVMDFMLEKTDAFALEKLIKHQISTLPQPLLYSMMNLLGSHDKPRAISVLSGRQRLEGSRGKVDASPLTSAEYELGKARYANAFRLICALPGMPTVYYGDEAGMTGADDPYCRGTYPWGKEDTELQAEIRRIIHNRNDSPILKTGEAGVRALDENRLEIVRKLDGETLSVVIDNRV
ncbi:MAG: glycoside hydrolase family 13 protein [Clostridiales bacterium]|nr:glycoside hydrolase family 13 protein [Clostridiales bacterium]